MSWWKRWKAKHWDETKETLPPSERGTRIPDTIVPPLRAFANAIWKDLVEHRWAAIGVIAAIIAALIAQP